ncbi:MAG: hypothetical protein NT068_01585 [Candidatus Nomurabacteria bacterium]|nr:hypothetical protein [Candidatus Nomurabacteria bacterium]
MKNFITPPSLAFSIEKASVILRTKESFAIWCNQIIPHMPRIGRYTTGARIENHFLDLLELIYSISKLKTKRTQDSKESKGPNFNKIIKLQSSE